MHQPKSLIHTVSYMQTAYKYSFAGQSITYTWFLAFSLGTMYILGHNNKIMIQNKLCCSYFPHNFLLIDQVQIYWSILTA